jgi:hypothetical protein
MNHLEGKVQFLQGEEFMALEELAMLTDLVAEATELG